MWILNQVMFFILLALFFLVSFRLASRRVLDKKKDQKTYFSLIASFPFGFLLCFFLIDPYWPEKNTRLVKQYFSDIFLYWLVLAGAGTLVGLLTYLYFVKKYKMQNENT